MNKDNYVVYYLSGNEIKYIIDKDGSPRLFHKQEAVDFVKNRGHLKIKKCLK
jgi:hypothetical protein